MTISSSVDRNLRAPEKPNSFVFRVGLFFAEPYEPWQPSKGPGFVAKVAKTFGVARVNAETLGEFRYAFSSGINNSSAIGLSPERLLNDFGLVRSYLSIGLSGNILDGTCSWSIKFSSRATTSRF